VPPTAMVVKIEANMGVKKSRTGLRREGCRFRRRTAADGAVERVSNERPAASDATEMGAEKSMP
jgi:hypothetical protein